MREAFPGGQIREVSRIKARTLLSFTRQKYEIEQIKRSIEERQALESDFYYSLNLDDWSKQKIFGFNVREKQQPKEFVLVQDPVLGNIIKRVGD